MNLSDERYSKYSIVKEMLESIDIIANFDPKRVSSIAKVLNANDKFLLTGEGSSRMFPAKRAIYENNLKKNKIFITTAGCTESLNFNLDDVVVLCASNSGKTKEAVRLLQKLKTEAKVKKIISITAASDSIVKDYSDFTEVLTCGAENAVAATKSVLEQALFYGALFREIRGEAHIDYNNLASCIKQVLAYSIDKDIIANFAKAPLVYYAGFSSGASEETRTKTNEITRQKADYLEGTYLLHGAEEVMREGEALLLNGGLEEDHAKVKELIEGRAKVYVASISCKKTLFPTIAIPNIQMDLTPYLELCASWNLLLEVGLLRGVNPDKPERARKIGNEF